MTDDVDARAREMADRAIEAGWSECVDKQFACDIDSKQYVAISGWGRETLAKHVTAEIAPLLAARAQAERERDEAVAERDLEAAGRYKKTLQVNTLLARAAALRKALERIAEHPYLEHPYLGSVARAEFQNIAREALAADQAGGEEAAPAQPYVSPYRKRNADPEMIEWRREPLLNADETAAIAREREKCARSNVHDYDGCWCTDATLLARARAAASPPQPATAGAPEGWRLVDPDNLTPEMIAAFHVGFKRNLRLKEKHRHNPSPPPMETAEAAGLRAMLSAAPSPAPDGRVRELETWLRRARKFMDDAPRLDFNEDRTLSWVAFACARIDALLAKEPSHGR